MDRKWTALADDTRAARVCIMALEGMNRSSPSLVDSPDGLEWNSRENVTWHVGLGAQGGAAIPVRQE